MMRNRSPFNPRRGMPGPAAGPVPPALVEANRRLQLGDFLGAASLFEHVADRASLNRPRHVPRLLIEAGRARMLAGQTEEGMRLLKRGLQVLDGQERYSDLHRLGMAVVSGLRLHDLTTQADEIQEWIRQKIGEQAAGRPQGGSAYRAVLPEKCPSCGGTVDPREVDWVSSDTVECAYCGSLVRGKAIG